MEDNEYAAETPGWLITWDVEKVARTPRELSILRVSPHWSVASSTSLAQKDALELMLWGSLDVSFNNCLSLSKSSWQWEELLAPGSCHLLLLLRWGEADPKHLLVG